MNITTHDTARSLAHKFIYLYQRDNYINNQQNNFYQIPLDNVAFQGSPRYISFITILQTNPKQSKWAIFVDRKVSDIIELIVDKIHENPEYYLQVYNINKK